MVTVLMHVKLLHATVQMGVLRLKVLILISPTVQCHMLTHSESTLLLSLCMDSLPVSYMSVMHFRIKHFPFMKESVSVHHPIIYTDLKYITQMLLSIEMMVHFFFNV